jgi:hypothetical protein
MFCPTCGIDEKQPNQFCRACGTNLRPVMDAVSRSDTVTAAAVSAREEIGRAMAEKIREMSTPKELKKIAEEVLPEMEKFLESPEERRLRRIRAGTITAFIGLAVAISFLMAAIISGDQGFLTATVLGAITFSIGLAVIINGYFHTVGKKRVSDDRETADAQRQLDIRTADLLEPQPAEDAARAFRSVTEGTTTHLADRDPR